MEISSHVGFGKPDAPHYEYIEFGRKLWQYRLAESTIVNDDKTMKYPKMCVHRGFSMIAPESSMSAYGVAIAMGSDEIEPDLWSTKDGEIVSCHDGHLDRVSTDTGKFTDHTLAESEQLDFEIKFGDSFNGMKKLKFEDILSKFSGHVIMNMHIKLTTFSGEYPDDFLNHILSGNDRQSPLTWNYMQCILFR